MKLKALCNHTLLILCSVLFLSLSVRVNAQKTGNDNVNPTHSTILKQSGATTSGTENWSFPDVVVGGQSQYVCRVGYGTGVVSFHANILGSNQDQFEVSTDRTCSGMGVAEVTVTFKPTSVGSKSITIQIFKDGDTANEAKNFNLSGNGIYPSLVVSDGDASIPEAKTYNDVSLTLNLIDLTKYHFISIPFTPTSVELRNLSGNSVDLSNYRLYKYDTFKRALSGPQSANNNWIPISFTEMEPGKGYIIAFDNAMGFVARMTFIRAAEFDATLTGTISLSDYTGVPDETNKNWYLVGSQTFDNYQLSGAGLLNAQRFNGTDYDLVNLATANSFTKYTAAFVQFSGTLTASAQMNPFRAPIQQNILSGQDNYLLTLASGTHTKQISIVTAPDGDDTYQIGKDLLMMGSMNHSELALAVDHTSGHLVADYISNNTQTLPLVTKLTVGTPYTFSLNYSQSHAQHVYLLDNETGDQTDLLVSDFSFVGSANAMNRFSLNIVMPKTPTSDELEKLENLTFVSGKNSLLIAGLTKNYSIHIFDVTGKQVAQVENMEEDFEVSNLESGVYIVEYTNGTEKGTEKVMIK